MFFSLCYRQLIFNKMKDKIENARKLLDSYYNFLMDEFNGNASEEAIDMFIQQKFKHYHVNNGVDDYCKECGYDLRSEIHSMGVV